MNPNDTAGEDLARALEDAEPRIVVQGTSGPVDRDTYIDKLHKVRSVHDVNDAQFVSLFRPDVSDEDKRNRVMDAMRSVLGDLVKDDTILCAQLSWDTPYVHATALTDVMSKLLELSLVHSPRDAGQRFVDAMRTNEFSFRKHILIEGIRVPEKIELAPGIELQGLPAQPTDLPNVLPVTAGIWLHPGRFIAKAMLSIHTTVSPRFLHPAIAGGQPRYHGDPVNQQDASLDGGTVHLPDLLTSLALCAKSRTYRSVLWCHVDPDDPYSGRQHGPLMHWSDEYDRGPSQITDADKTEILDTYKGIQQFDAQQQATVRISLDRWNRSLRENRLDDQVIDLAIALECLYLNGIDRELGYRLGLRVAYLLGESEQERTDYAKAIGRLYRARSNIVHEGVVVKSKGDTIEDIETLVPEVQELYRQGTRRILSDGQLPKWEALILAGANR